MLRNNRGQWAIIEIVVVMAIIVVAAWYFYPKYIGEPGQGIQNGGPATPKERAESVECQSNLTQVRAAINMYQQSNEQYPASLADMSEVNSISKCPISEVPYSYDPGTGRVWCTTPGHEQY